MKRAVISGLLSAAIATSATALGGTLPQQYVPYIPRGTDYQLAKVSLIARGWLPVGHGCARQGCRVLFQNSCGERFFILSANNHVLGARGATAAPSGGQTTCDPMGRERD